MNLQKIALAAFGILLLGLPIYQAIGKTAPPSGAWLAGDLHNHTLLTDGGRQMEEVFAHGFQFGLDWMANSEHGGAFGRNPQGQPWPENTNLLGKPPEGKMWRWQSLWQYSFPLLAKIRDANPGKLIFQGYEWNVPTHDHASVGIVGADENFGLNIARHDYLFDADDTGASADGTLGVSGKSSVNDHQKALAGVRWLVDHYPTSSYFVVNHPSRQLQYSVADLRDFNDLAPQVAFGFEGIPGHQKAASRGGYHNGPFHDATGQDITARARTYGGADYMLAKVGGTWDALLGEGRRFFTFVNSDFHQPDYDFWPGEYAKDYVYVRDTDRDGTYSGPELLAGMRSGKAFIVLGDLVNGLEFKIDNGWSATDMGGAIAIDEGTGVDVTIRFRSPQTNNNGDAVTVDHIDLIAGEVHGKAKKFLFDGHTPNPDYSKATNESTKVIASFTDTDWHEGKDGWRTIVYRLPNIRHNLYLRLRGTNLACGTPGLTDEACNPVNDEVKAPNSADKAYHDLWFYSNPLFITIVR